jgi:hypothetical protein
VDIIGKILAGIIGGLLVGVLAGFFLTYAAHAPGLGANAILIGWALSLVWCLVAKTAGKAWRYMFVTSALLCFLMPIAGMLFTGHLLEGNSTGAEMAGTVTVGALFSGILGFAGFFLGAVLLVIGLLCGKDKPQVIIVQQAPDSKAS